jgi:hypothetical protein
MERGHKKRKRDTSKMNKWKVYATSIIKYEIEVTASSEDEAIDKAHSIDGGDWVEAEDCPSDWEVTKAEKVKE